MSSVVALTDDGLVFPFRVFNFSKVETRVDASSVSLEEMTSPDIIPVQE